MVEKEHSAEVCNEEREKLRQGELEQQVAEGLKQLRMRQNENQGDLWARLSKANEKLERLKLNRPISLLMVVVDIYIYSLLLLWDV